MKIFRLIAIVLAVGLSGQAQASTCGDGTLESAVEQCDDGNTTSGDGCSAYCEVERAQTKAQQKCINDLNKAGSKVSKTQGKINSVCVKNTGKEREIDPDSCVTADGKGKLAKAKAKTVAIAQRSCTETPDFGYTDATTVNDAASGHELSLQTDVFGDSLDSALYTAWIDKRAAYCQAFVAKTYEKIMGVKLKAFLKCKKDGLKSGYINSQARLEGCFDEIIADPKGKIAKTIAKLDKTMDKKCGEDDYGDDIDDAFPGTCEGESEFAQCVDTLVECRVCLMLNAMDGLSADCDAFDDGVLNGGCGTTLCGPNQHVLNNACVACSPGTVNEGGDDVSGSDTLCDVCAAGSYDGGANSCVACVDGTVSGPGSTACTPCLAGEYADGASSCVACADGTVSGPGSTACTTCAAGSYDGGANSCVACSSPCTAGFIEAAACTATSDRVCVPSQDPTYCATEDCWGGDGHYGSSDLSKDQCELECNAEAGCIGYMWNTSGAGFDCYLFSTCGANSYQSDNWQTYRSDICGN